MCHWHQLPWPSDEQFSLENQSINHTEARILVRSVKQLHIELEVWKQSGFIK